MEREVERLVGLFESGKLSRRELVKRVSAVAALVAAGGRAAAQSAPSTVAKPMFQATRLNHVALRVPDVARSRDWYAQHLGLTITDRNSDSSCFLTYGNCFLALFRGAPPRMDHYCYSIEHYDPHEAMKKLKAAGIEADRESNRVYFPDPDGLRVQIASETHGP